MDLEASLSVSTMLLAAPASALIFCRGFLEDQMVE
jgi:hypothetical protein